MEQKDINIDDLRMHYKVDGPEGGEPVILMHGWGCESSTVASIAAALADRLKVYSLDLPGFGKSDEPRSVWGVEEYSSLVEKFAKELGLKRPILIGHSFGGRISLLFGSRNETGRIVLVDAAGVKPRRSLKYHLKVKSFKVAKRLLPLLLGKKTGNRLIEKWRKRAGSSDYSSASQMMRAILSKCVNEDLCSVMPRIKASTLLVWGEKDTATPLRDAQVMQKLIPDAGLVSFPGCGHYSFLDNPAGFRAVVREFLINQTKDKQ